MLYCAPSPLRSDGVKSAKKIGSCSAVDFFYRNLLAIDAGLTGCETSVCFFRGERDVSRHKKKGEGVVGGESPLILLIFFSALLLRTAAPVSERLEQAMSTRTKSSGSSGRHE